MKVLLFIFVSALLTFGIIVLVGYFLGKTLSKIAIYRKAFNRFKVNKNILKIFTKSRDFVNALTFFSERLRTKDTEKVSIKSHDGLILKGHLSKAQNPKRFIIAVHGWRADWCRDFGIVSDFFEDSQSSVLYVEQRASSESEGDYIGFGIVERFDILEWIKYLDSRNSQGLPIYLCGVSMGASTVLMCAGFDLPLSVRGIISDSGFTSVEGIWDFVLKRRLRIPYFLFRNIASEEFRKMCGVEKDSYSTIEGVSRSRIPILFIHGYDDSFVPVEMTYQNYNACKSPKHLFITQGANHCMSYYVNKTRYEREMLSFFTLYDNVKEI